MTPRPSHERGYISKHVLGELALSVMQGMSFVVTPVTSAGRADRVSFFPPPRGREMMYIWRSAGDENIPRERPLADVLILAILKLLSVRC